MPVLARHPSRSAGKTPYQRTSIAVTTNGGDVMVLAANGWWLWTIVAVAIWVAIAFWPARVAARKGHSFIGYFLFSVFFPAALIVAYMVSDKSGYATT
jgi:hypothetical protein